MIFCIIKWMIWVHQEHGDYRESIARVLNSRLNMAKHYYLIYPLHKRPFYLAMTSISTLEASTWNRFRYRLILVSVMDFEYFRVARFLPAPYKVWTSEKQKNTLLFDTAWRVKVKRFETISSAYTVCRTEKYDSSFIFLHIRVGNVCCTVLNNSSEQICGLSDAQQNEDGIKQWFSGQNETKKYFMKMFNILSFKNVVKLCAVFSDISEWQIHQC